MLSLRFSRARWSHYETKSSAESKIPRRTEVGIDLISKITAVFSHRHDRSPAGFFFPSFLPSFPFALFPSYLNRVREFVPVDVAKGETEKGKRGREHVDRCRSTLRRDA